MYDPLSFIIITFIYLIPFRLGYSSAVCSSGFAIQDILK